MTSKPDPLAVFRELPLFKNASDEELREIDGMADEVALPAGRVLVKAGEIGREFVLVIEGEVSIERDGRELARLGPGSHFGELALLDERTRNATVTAVTDLVVQVIDRRNFSALLEDSHSLTMNLLRATAHRLSDVDDELSRLKSN